MSDQSFREIQLSGKGLILLFMGSVVVLVAVFLLGVSVGGGVQQNRDEADAAGTTMTADAGTAVEPLEPTELMPGDQRYHDELQGTTTAPAQNQPPPDEVNEPIDSAPAAAPPAVEQAKPTPPVATPPAAAPAAATATNKPAPAIAKPAPVAVSTSKPAPAPVTSKPAPAAATPRTETASGGWFLQVDAFRSRANADRQVSQLTAKKYPAFVVRAGELFRVRIGPYSQRPEAESVATRLRREGMKPSVTR